MDNNIVSLYLTGATGYLGKRFKLALESSYNVVCLGRTSADTISTDKFVQIDTLNTAYANSLGEKIFFNFMALYGRKGEDLSAIYETNLVQSIRCFEWARKNQFSIFVNIDTSLPAEVSPYAQSKSFFRDFLREATELRDAPKVLNLRLEHFYGPDEDITKFFGWLISNLKSNAPLKLTKGDQVRDFVYVDDVISALLLILEKRSIFTQKFQTVSIGTGRGATVREIIEMIKSKMRSSTPLEFGALDKRLHEPEKLIADIKILESIGWTAKVSLSEGIEKILSDSQIKD